MFFLELLVSQMVRNVVIPIVERGVVNIITTVIKFSSQKESVDRFDPVLTRRSLKISATRSACASVAVCG